MRDRQRQPQQRAAARRGLGAHGPAVQLGHLPHDRQAEARSPRARAPPSRGRSGRRRAGGRPSSMPGPWSRTVSSPSRSRTSTAPSGGLHLAALSSRLATARSSRAALAGDHARLERRSSNATCGRVAARALDRGGHELVEPQRLGRLAGASPSRASSTRSPTSSPSSSSWATRSRRRRSRSAAGSSRWRAEHLEVGAQRGQRRAQLVRRVGDELALRALRVVERLEHRVERRREPARARRRRSASMRREQVARAGDVLGRLGQLGRPGARRGGWRSGRGTPPARCRRARAGRGRGAAARAPCRPRSSAARAGSPVPFGARVVKKRTCTPSTCVSSKNGAAPARRPPPAPPPGRRAAACWPRRGRRCGRPRRAG